MGSLSKGNINLYDLIYSEQTRDWVMLMLHPDFEGAEDELKFESGDEQNEPPQVVGLYAEYSGVIKTSITSLAGFQFKKKSNRVLWYEKSQPEIGYELDDFIDLIKAREINEFSLVGKSSAGPWKKLNEWQEFAAGAEDSKLLFSLKRKEPRVECGQVFIFGTKENAFQAFCPDISRSGMAFVTKEVRANLHTTLYLKMSDQMVGGGYDAKVSVVGLSEYHMPDSGKVYVRHAVHFLQLSDYGKKKLEELLTKAHVAA